MNKHRELYKIERAERVDDALYAIAVIVLAIACGVLLAWRG